MKKTSNKVIAIVGPTASGKSDYAINLAKEIDGEIISADSRLVYKYFDIGTAKPTLKERCDIPHYMIDIVDPDKDYSVGLYVKEAKQYIQNILSKGKTPLIVGGTGLYINALLMNYQFPKIEPDLDLRNKLKECENLYEMLYDLDEETAKTIDKNDTKKLIRAIEIVKISGKKISQNRSINHSEYDIEWIGRNFERNELYERINKRVDLMVEKGLIDETKTLLNKYGHINNLVCTIGYQEIVSYLDGNISFDEAILQIKQNTRKYAKRQLTWFRKNNDIKWNVYPIILKK